MEKEVACNLLLSAVKRCCATETQRSGSFQKAPAGAWETKVEMLRRRNGQRSSVCYLPQ